MARSGPPSRWPVLVDEGELRWPLAPVAAIKDLQAARSLAGKHDLGVAIVRNATSAKAERLLGWKPRPREDVIVDTARSLLKLGIVNGAAR